jgi:hypothetical protein
MRAPSAAQLLTAWERGAHQPMAARALLLLIVAWPEMSPQALAQLSIGERNSRLLTLREELFGPILESLVSCPACSERVEIEPRVHDIQAPSPAGDSVLELESGDFHVRFRVPNSEDVLSVLTNQSPRDGRRELIQRCLLDARQGEHSMDVEALPVAIGDVVAQRMAEADPQADLQLAMHCPSCGHAWSARFDIAAYLWAEIETWARRILREVHALASAYGWSEEEILGLSPARRQAYLDLIGAR